MADSWEDDWETEADKLVAGVALNDIDESKFEGEDEGFEDDDWDAEVPAPKVRLPRGFRAACWRAAAAQQWPHAALLGTAISF
jgi:hypothetical protein